MQNPIDDFVVLTCIKDIITFYQSFVMKSLRGHLLIIGGGGFDQTLRPICTFEIV